MRAFAGLSAVLVALGLALPGAQAAAAPLGWNFLTANAVTLVDPDATPAGANDWSCRPSAARPHPVVLVHGTAENRFSNWAGLAPWLAAKGYCVFALNYGDRHGAPIKALDDVRTSAAELSAFVDRVRAATGAAEVDLVGHSQGGGVTPRYYLRFLGGAAKVRALVALAGSNQGTTLLGVGTLVRSVPGAPAVVALGCPACEQQIIGSSLLAELNSGPDTVPGVAYTTISTRYDEIVTPYRNTFLEGVAPIVLQDGCEIDLTDHLGISYDPRAWQFIDNALDPATATTPPCLPVLPVIS